MIDESFEAAAARSGGQQRGETSSNSNSNKWPYRKIQPAIGKAIKILRIDLDRLDKHRSNIVKFQLLEDWQSLNKEHINSSRTVQQLKSNIKQLENIRLQVADDDVAVFDAKVAEIQQKAITSVKEFLQPQIVDVAGSHPQCSDFTRMCSTKMFTGPASLPEPSFSGTNQVEPFSERTSDLSLLQEQAEASRVTAEAEQSWDELKESLEDLNDLIHDFSGLVQEQQTAVDSIEDNVENAQENVSQGITHLVTANKLKAAAFPVAGALLGTVVGGPVGLVVGIKAGLAAAGVGSVLGFTSGSFLKKRQAKNMDIELSHLSKEKSKSLPDIPNADDRDALQGSYHEDT